MGDKVCCTKNGYISDKDDENMQEEPAHDAAGTFRDISSTQRKNEPMKEKRERMCNREIFFIIGVKCFVKMSRFDALLWFCNAKKPFNQKYLILK